MKLRLNTDVAQSDPREYNPVLTAHAYFFKTPVKNGATYLDATYPGWARRIDTQTFNMRYTGSDVLAQVHNGDARNTPEYRNWSDASLHAHGMRLIHSDPNAYDALTLEWLDAIANRVNMVGK